jgi:hypothetical protein
MGEFFNIRENYTSFVIDRPILTIRQIVTSGRRESNEKRPRRMNLRGRCVRFP